MFVIVLDGRCGLLAAVLVAEAIFVLFIWIAMIYSKLTLLSIGLTLTFKMFLHLVLCHSLFYDKTR